MPENSSKTTQTTTKTSKLVVEVNEEEAHPIGRVRSRLASMDDYEVTGLSNPITHFVFCFLFFVLLIVILQLLRVMSKKKNGEKKWMMKSIPLKRMTPGRCVIFLRGIKPLV